MFCMYLSNNLSCGAPPTTIRDRSLCDQFELGQHSVLLAPTATRLTHLITIVELSWCPSSQSSLAVPRDGGVKCCLLRACADRRLSAPNRRWRGGLSCARDHTTDTVYITGKVASLSVRWPCIVIHSPVRQHTSLSVSALTVTHTK